MKKIKSFIILLLLSFGFTVQAQNIKPTEDSLNTVMELVIENFESALRQLGANEDRSALRLYDSCSKTTFVFDNGNLSVRLRNGTDITLLKREVDSKDQFLLSITENGTIQITEISQRDYILLVIEKLHLAMPELALFQKMYESGAEMVKSDTLYHGKLIKKTVITYRGKDNNDDFTLTAEITDEDFEIRLDQDNRFLRLIKANRLYYYGDEKIEYPVELPKCYFYDFLGPLFLFVSEPSSERK